MGYGQCIGGHGRARAWPFRRRRVPYGADRRGAATCLDRLAELATGIGGELASAIAAHAEAVRDHDAAKLAEAGQRFELLGALLSAADIAAQAAVAFEATDNRRGSVEAAAAAT